MHDVTGVADISRIGDITRQHARTRPDRVAIHFEGQRLTFDLFAMVLRSTSIAYSGSPAFRMPSTHRSKSSGRRIGKSP